MYSLMASLHILDGLTLAAILRRWRSADRDFTLPLPVATKKLDILEFVKKLKEEKEAEIERFSDLLQQNTDHKLREEVMALRQKAVRPTR